MNFKLIFISPLVLICVTLKAQIATDSTRILDTASIVFEKVDVEASFPGGDQAWKTYIETHLNGQVAADHGAPDGSYTVIVQFVVNKEGNISDVRALTNHGYGMEKEVIRIIKTGPDWIPGMMHGQPVKCYRKQPVTFVIISERKSKKKKNKNDR